MRRERNVAFKGDLFESLLVPQLFELPKELAVIDQLLDDERFLQPIPQGRIAHLKHACQPHRSRYGGTERAFTWSSEGAVAHDLTRTARWLLALAPAGA